MMVKARGQTLTEEGDESGGEEDLPLCEIITAQCAFDRMQGRLFESAASLQNLLEVHCIKKVTSGKQTTIKDVCGQ